MKFTRVVCFSLVWVLITTEFTKYCLQTAVLASWTTMILMTLHYHLFCIHFFCWDSQELSSINYLTFHTKSVHGIPFWSTVLYLSWMKHQDAVIRNISLFIFLSLSPHEREISVWRVSVTNNNSPYMKKKFSRKMLNQVLTLWIWWVRLLLISVSSSPVAQAILLGTYAHTCVYVCVYV